MAPHSSTLAWKISWTEEPGALQSMGLLTVGHNWATSLSLVTFMHWTRKWQPTRVFLPGESQGRRSLVGCIVQSMGSHRVRHDWSDLAAAAVSSKRKEKGLFQKWHHQRNSLGLEHGYRQKELGFVQLSWVAQSCPTLCDPIDWTMQPTRLHRPWDSPGKNIGVGSHFLLQYMKMKSESKFA